MRWVIIGITEHFKHLWPCPSSRGKQRSRRCRGNGNVPGMWEVGAGAVPQFCGRGSTSPGCVNAPNCVRNTNISSSALRQGRERFSVPGEHFPPSSCSCLGDFHPQGCPMTLQSPLLLSLGRGCSPSLRSKGSVGIRSCSDGCKEHCCSCTSFLPNSWPELLVQLEMLAIAFTLSPQLPAPLELGSGTGVSLSSEIPGSSAEEWNQD